MIHAAHGPSMLGQRRGQIQRQRPHTHISGPCRKRCCLRFAYFSFGCDLIAHHWFAVRRVVVVIVDGTLCGIAFAINGSFVLGTALLPAFALISTSPRQHHLSRRLPRHVAHVAGTRNFTDWLGRWKSCLCSASLTKHSLLATSTCGGCPRRQQRSSLV